MSMFMRGSKTADNSAAEIPMSPKAPATEETKPVERSRRSSVPSLISAGMTVKGNLESAGEIQIDGDVEGDVKGKAIVVGHEGVIKGSVVGDLVTIAGTVEGKVEGTTINIQTTARVTGDIIHEVLNIDSGAYVEGRCSPYKAKAKFKTAVDTAGAFGHKPASVDEEKFEEAASAAN